MKREISFFNKKVHFIGIAGAGMVALAQYLRSFGRCKISGSDLTISKAVKDLEIQGVEIFKGHHENQVKPADIVVYSSAIPSKNPELALAKKKKKLCLTRGQFLAFLMQDYSRKLVVAGTHGKTTTTGLMVHILDVAGVTPSFMVGGELPPYFTNGRYSQSSTFIAESDESDGSFLHLTPDAAILTNIEQEHLNYYKTPENLYNAFSKFIDKTLKNDGHIIVNKDDSKLVELCSNIKQDNIIYFAINNTNAQFSAKNIEFKPTSVVFDVYHYDKICGCVDVNLLGMHNVYNVLSCVALALNIGISFEKIAEGLRNFKGVKRRLQLISEAKNIKVFDDYGHHPTEVKVTINGLKKAQPGNLTCVFQPHRYSRVKEHLIDFFDAFNEVDKLLLTPIYSANESAKTPELLEEMISGIKMKMKGEVLVFQEYQDIVKYLSSSLKSGDILLTMGAGDIFKVSHQLAEFYKDKK